MLSILTRVLSWIWRGLSIFAPVAGVLWAATVFGGIALSLYTIFDQTHALIGQFGNVFNSWADNLSVTISDLFSTVSSNSFASLLFYVTSFDVLVEWFRSCADSFLRFWLFYAVGSLLACIEVVVVVLGIYWLRSRLKKITFGQDASGGLGGGLIS